MTRSSLRFTADEDGVITSGKAGSAVTMASIRVCQRFNAYAVALGLDGRLEYRKLEGYIISEGPTGLYRVGSKHVADLLNDQIELLNELKG